MSVSVTVHDVDQPMVPNPLADRESVRKIANEKLRIQRLVQVRQQSKQLAAKVRQNYQQAKEKELAKIEQTKREELKAWKRQHIRALKDEYARGVCEVGEAHRAAEAAEECAVWFEEKRATKQAVALQRGKTAEAKAARERNLKEAQKEAKQRKKQYVPSKSIAVQTAIPSVEVPATVVNAEKDAILADGDTSTEPTPSPYEQFRSSRHGKPLHTLPETNLSESEDERYCPGSRGVHNDKENVPAMGHEYSATAFTSPSDFRPNTVTPPTITKPQRLQPFTQITELIQQRRRQRQNSLHDETRQPSGAYRDTYGTQKTVQFDNLSDNTLSFPTSSVLTHDDRPFPIGTNESPRKAPPRKMVEKPKTLPSVQISEQQRQEETALGKRRKKAVPPESSSSTSASYGGACSTKVQYYDCNTKYRKEYDQPVGFVQREDHRSNDPTGMEEANRYELLQQELAKARSKPTVDRTKPALEKQQTRKDYEKLSKELDNLTRTENKLKSLAIPAKTVPLEATVKQQAITRQRKAAEAVESLLRQRALVTCPVIQTSSDLRQPTARPSVVNVAARTGSASSTAQPEGKGNTSTDSCASIVLDTFERPAIPLPSEATGGLDKIAKLKELLDQINEQRRLLTDELAREKAEQDRKKASDQRMDDAGTAKLEIERLERMKRRQEELLEQQRLLQKREQEVEELARQLEAKLAMLGGKQQKHHPPSDVARKGRKEAKKTPTIQVETKAPKGTVDVDVVQPSSASSSISEASKDSNETVDNRTSDAAPPPVKIIITVNEKKHKKKSTQKKKSPVRVTSEGSEKQTSVEPQPIQPILKPLATRKDALARKKVIEFSPGSSSTTSTIYRPLPPKIGSLKILQQPGTVSEPAKQNLPEGTKATSGMKYHLQQSDDRRKVGITAGANLNPNLLKYIVRLLGMSRQSIDQLGVSSTSVSTPNESVVNVSSNVAGGGGGGGGHSIQHGPLAPNEEEVERVNRLRKFIDENYNFLQEIDETLRRSDQSTLGGSDRSGASELIDGSLMNEPSDEAEVSRVEGIWMETLRRRERAMQKQQRKAPVGNDEQPVKGKPGKKLKDKPRNVDRENQSAQPTTGETAQSKGIESASQPPQTSSAPTVKEGSLKSILKSPKRDTSSKVAKIITPQGHVEVINLSDREEQEILERYSQLTERCSQRITELSQMINQVREEKRRLIEDSLSSLDQQESTKYMDLPPAISSSLAAQPPLGVRNPSDVVSSPPGPSSAPTAGVPPNGDDPVSEEIDNIFSSKQIGLSKDSGIAMSRPLTASDIRESPSEEGSQGREPLPFEPFLKDIPKPAPGASTGGQVEIAAGPKLLSLRRSTPPVAIARFSPQLPDELPMHELSTIPEVETPAPIATSKVTDLSTVSVTAGDNANTAEVLAEARNRLLLNEPSIPDIGYDRFPNYEEYVRNTTTGTGTASFVHVELEQTGEPVEKSGSLVLDVTEQRDPERLAYRKYPGQAPAFDITEEGETTPQQSVVAGGTPAHKSDSDASLPDVVAELRKRNIFLKPFDNSLDNSNRSTPLSDTQDTPGPGVTQQQKQDRSSRQPGQSPRKEIANVEQSLLSELFRRDLDSAGFRWASSMLKRTQLEQHSSDSSPNSLAGVGSKAISPNDDTVENGAEGAGKPVNLNEFLTRELLVHSRSDLQSLSSSVSSSSHGTLLRSLLEISRLDNSHTHSTPIRELLMHTPTGDGKSIQRTSTPVASKSTASGNSLRMAGDGNTDTAVTNRTETGLFSGESRLSSVHWSSSSGNSSDRQEPPPNRLKVPDKFTLPALATVDDAPFTTDVMDRSDVDAIPRGINWVVEHSSNDPSSQPATNSVFEVANICVKMSAFPTADGTLSLKILSFTIVLPTRHCMTVPSLCAVSSA
uniref:Uncharacterized protein n=1 Tax=Anopheles culicifacies TaxID=139723 RepID=A0A182MN26_9DIPT